MYYMIYKFGGITAEELKKNRNDVFEKYGKDNWYIFDRDNTMSFDKLLSIHKTKKEIKKWCVNFIKSLPPTTIVVVDVRNGVGRLGWEEIRAAEQRGLQIETFGGPLPTERRYL